MTSGFHAPMRDGNRFSLLREGSEFFPRMLAAIDASREYVLAEFYLVESGMVADEFFDAFVRAAARGVRVRLLFDAFGSRGLNETDRGRMRAARIDLAFYNTSRWHTFPRPFLRNHRKLLLTDNTRGFTGGTGIADMFSPAARPDDYWMDCVVEIAGPVLDDWRMLFAATWKRSTRRELDVSAAPAAKVHSGERGCVAASGGYGTNELGRSVARRIRKAKSRIWVATAYFWPSARLRQFLRRAARRGVDVRLLLPGPHTDAPAARAAARLFYPRLLNSGVVIYEYQPRFLHAKVVLCDDWATLGSSNLDRWGVLWNLEANQEIESAAFAREVEAMLVQAAERSLELRDADQLEHGWSVPLWRWVARAVLAWSMQAVARLRRPL